LFLFFYIDTLLDDLSLLLLLFHALHYYLDGLFFLDGLINIFAFLATVKISKLMDPLPAVFLGLVGVHLLNDQLPIALELLVIDQQLFILFLGPMLETFWRSGVRLVYPTQLTYFASPSRYSTSHLLIYGRVGVVEFVDLVVLHRLC